MIPFQRMIRAIIEGAEASVNRECRRGMGLIGGTVKFWVWVIGRGVEFEGGGNWV